jgi:hypothetical protein
LKRRLEKVFSINCQMKPNPLFNLNLKKDKNALEKGCEWAKELGENKRHK